MVGGHQTLRAVLVALGKRVVKRVHHPALQSRPASNSNSNSSSSSMLTEVVSSWHLAVRLLQWCLLWEVQQEQVHRPQPKHKRNSTYNRKRPPQRPRRVRH